MEIKDDNYYLDDDDLDLSKNRSIMTVEIDGRYSSVFSIYKDNLNQTGLDSHADTCVGGANTILLEPSGATATVHSFSDESTVEDDHQQVAGMSTEDGKSTLKSEILARRWHIGLKTADRTLRATSQRGLRSFNHPIDRRLPLSQPHLSYSVMNKGFTPTQCLKM